MSITINDVAKAAGTSPSTVSKVINDSHTISEATKRKVKRVIEEMGYKPNSRAQTLARKATNSAVFLTQLTRDAAFLNPHMFEILSGAESCLAKKGYTLQLQGCDPKSVCEIAKDIMERKSADGLLLHASVVTRELSLMITKSEFPHMVIGMPDFPSQLCWIDNNNQLSGSRAADHLLDQGYTRIAFIGGTQKDHISYSRRQGCIDALNLEGISIPEEFVLEGESTVEDGEEMTRALLCLKERPEAIICANNYIAYGCVRGLQQAGVRIPEEVALITFDDYPFARITHPKLTTVSIDVYDMGKQAAQMLIQKIKKPMLQIQTYTTLPHLLARGSTGEIQEGG